VIHAVKCRNLECKNGTCGQFRNLKEHVNSCSRTPDQKCDKCRPLVQVLKAHAKFCTKVNCIVPNCASFKMEYRIERVKQKFQHNRCLQRRMRMMLQQMSDPESETVEAANNTTVDPQAMEVD